MFSPEVQQVAVMTSPSGYWQTIPPPVLGSERQFKPVEAVTRHFEYEVASVGSVVSPSFGGAVVLSATGIPRAMGKRAIATRATSFMMREIGGGVV